MGEVIEKMRRRAFKKANGIEWKDRPRDVRTPIERHYAAEHARRGGANLIAGNEYIMPLSLIEAFTAGKNRSERRAQAARARKAVR